MLLYFIPNNKEEVMKKYFAKYLPVEGEIRKGLLVRNNLDGLIGECMREPSKEEIRDKEYSLVKLFLCSRDIQVGDKCKFVSEDGRVFNSLLEGEDNINFVDRFKVIGEISPNATWVKEGDEFDENQLQIKYHITYRCLCKEKDGCEDESCQHYEGGVNKYVNGCYRQELLRTAYEIKVKGPCGHFH